MPHTRDAVVVGAGIVGLCTAFRLVRAGLKTVVLERGRVASGATGAATGIIPRDTGSDGAFARLCRAGAVELDRVLDELGEIVPDAAAGIAHERTGGLQLILSQDDLPAARGAFAAESARGVPAQWWNADELRRNEPAVTSGALAAVHYPTVRRLNARGLAAALAEAITRAGGEIRCGAAVTRIAPAGPKNLRVVAADEFESPIVVAASGAWAGLGLADIPPVAVEPVRGQAVRLRGAPGAVRHILMFGDRHIVPHPDGSVIVGATAERVGFDDRTTAAGIGRLLADAIRAVPALAGAKFEAAWSGLRPKSLRRVPFIGAPAEPAGAFVAAGHYKSGLLLGPVTGRLIVELATGAATCVDPGPYRLDR